jgi:hypothetical protein
MMCRWTHDGGTCQAIGNSRRWKSRYILQGYSSRHELSPSAKSGSHLIVMLKRLSWPAKSGRDHGMTSTSAFLPFSATLGRTSLAPTWLRSRVSVIGVDLTLMVLRNELYCITTIQKERSLYVVLGEDICSWIYVHTGSNGSLRTKSPSPADSVMHRS